MSCECAMDFLYKLIPCQCLGWYSATTWYALAGFGLALLLGVRIAWLFTKRFLLPAVSLKRFGAGKGAWAVVTGASDGIGKQFAIDLAKRGFNVLLLSRTESKLRDVCGEIAKAAPKVRSDYLAVDFCDLGVFAEIERKLGELDGPVGVLVNNVGINYEYPMLYHELERSWDQSIIDVNIKGLNLMTDLVLPGMVDQGYGAIINMSSLVGMVPAPMLSTYTGSKAYIRYFSECLAHEYRSKGIAVMAVTPGLVVSNMTKIKKASTTVSTPKIISGRALANIGRHDVYCPDNVQASMEYIMGIDVIRKFIVGQVFNMNKGVQKGALKKKARLAAQKQGETASKKKSPSPRRRGH